MLVVEWWRRSRKRMLYHSLHILVSLKVAQTLGFLIISPEFFQESAFPLGFFLQMMNLRWKVAQIFTQFLS